MGKSPGSFLVKTKAQHTQLHFQMATVMVSVSGAYSYVDTLRGILAI